MATLPECWKTHRVQSKLLGLLATIRYSFARPFQLALSVPALCRETTSDNRETQGQG
jgi:hypothetical protein